MSGVQALSAGFADPVHDAQRAFRAALDALARPGKRVDVGHAIDGLPLGAAMAHLLLALTDDDTAVWWQDGAEAAVSWLRFHTGAKTAAAPNAAAFAAIVGPLAMPALDAFAQGSLASPEFSATLLIEVDSLDAGPSLQWHGPGIRDAQAVRITGLPDGFWAQWQANHGNFPQGVDVIFTCGAQAIGLPRTTRVSRLEGI
jgi:alpha-D-ribose 1-methylphosphonate 5-triphosphate synthase subunit PhnH